MPSVLPFPLCDTTRLPNSRMNSVALLTPKAVSIASFKMYAFFAFLLFFFFREEEEEEEEEDEEEDDEEEDDEEDDDDDDEDEEGSVAILAQAGLKPCAVAFLL